MFQIIYPETHIFFLGWFKSSVLKGSTTYLLFGTFCFCFLFAFFFEELHRRYAISSGLRSQQHGHQVPWIHQIGLSEVNPPKRHFRESGGPQNGLRDSDFWGFYNQLPRMDVLLGFQPFPKCKDVVHPIETLPFDAMVVVGYQVSPPIDRKSS